ncbi:hypothetical protein [Micromonospora wenchangensis]|uniref:hypothetical protein n=1 Tax=Micromonospora wenchangensis TaxID=1185415 RepID=UPI0038166BAA
MTITSREIYDQVVLLRDSVGRLVDQLGGHADDVRDHETRLRTIEDSRPGPRITDLDTRLRQVEARLWPLPAASLLIALAALAIGLLPKLTT